MASLRRLASMYRELAKEHGKDPDVLTAPDGVSGYAKLVQINLVLFRIEFEESLCETEESLNEISGVLAVFNLDEIPYYRSYCR